MPTLVRNLLLSVLLLAGLTDSALADRHGRDRHQERERDYEDRGRDRGRDENRERGISLDQAVKMAERRFNARVVRTETLQEGGRTVYRLRLMSNDRVWTVTVDAATGSMR